MMASLNLSRFPLFNTLFGTAKQSHETVITRVVVSEDDAFVLPARIRMVRVQGGQAWVSYQSSDFFLYRGQKLQLIQGTTAVITSIGRKPVTLDLYSQKR